MPGNHSSGFQQLLQILDQVKPGSSQLLPVSYVKIVRWLNLAARIDRFSTSVPAMAQPVR
jgi:hypothetical protein